MANLCKNFSVALTSSRTISENVRFPVREQAQLRIKLNDEKRGSRKASMKLRELLTLKIQGCQIARLVLQCD